jgi:hypothetical protein
MTHAGFAVRRRITDLLATLCATCFAFDFSLESLDLHEHEIAEQLDFGRD